MAVYECMFVLDTGKVAGDTAAADKQVRALLEKNKAEVLVSRPWDERRLTYPIKKHKKGLYFLTYVSGDGQCIAGIRRDCALSELILRQMILRIHPKLVDTMLAVAKGEHAVALHNVQQEPEEGAEEIGEIGGPPRGRRSEF